MGGQIDCYMDCSSFYSYMAFVYLLKRRDALAAYDVTIDFIPVFLGGINHGSGNKPPWTLPAKAKYGQYDVERAKKYFELENVKVPDFFPAVTLLPQRALCYVKSTFPSKFEATWLLCLEKIWTPPQVNISDAEKLRGVLSASQLFSEQEVSDILKAAGEKEWKDKLLSNTQNALESGAFGAPWSMVRNSEGKQEPFFGSDKFHYMWDFLGVPWKDVEILPPKSSSKL